MQEKLIIIDGYGILFRAFFAMPQLTTQAGIPIGAVYGFVNIVSKLLQSEKYNYAVIALDSGSGDSVRKKIYPQYKANRNECPKELLPQFDILDEAIIAMGVASYRMSGYEADDIICSYANIAKKNETKATIVSSDKDLMQLVGDGVHLYNAAIRKTYNENAVLQKFGVNPQNIADLLSLVGDASDNIPGVPSIGNKTAISLIEQFGNIANIYANLDNIKSAKIKKTLIENKHLADISHQLVQLHNITVPSMNDIKFATLNSETMRQFGEKYDFSLLSDTKPTTTENNQNDLFN